MSKVTTIFAAAILALAGLAHAATVDYTVSGCGPTQYPGPHAPPAGAPHLLDGLGYPGDAVALTTYTGTLDLTPGTCVQKINALSWSISYTYNGTDDNLANDSPAGGDWPDLQFLIDAARTMSFGAGPASSLSQTGLLEATWDNDFLSVSEGATSTFFVPGYKIDVTPLLVAQAAGSNFAADPPWIQPDRDIMARFDVTAVPEPSVLVLLVTAGLGVLAYAWHRR